MDKSWIYEDKYSPKFLPGLANFMEFALKSSVNGIIACPCIRCDNRNHMLARVVCDHVWDNGFSPSYTCWNLHGESLSDGNDQANHASPSHSSVELDANLKLRQYLQQMATGYSNIHHDEEGATYNADCDNIGGGENIQPNDEVLKFHGLMKELDEELFKGCKKHSKLSWILDMFHKKCMGKWSDKSFKGVLDSCRETFPEGEKLPKSSYEIKKLISSIGLPYEKIHACPNNCMLFWKQSINDEVCSICGASRWKVEKNCDENQPILKRSRKMKAAKILRWFPLKARLKKLFMCSETASMMQWHHNERTKDGYLRHPADALAWKEFDARYEDFSSDPRNVRLGLASDGFNPFKDIVHSTWPVVLTVYNFPPWMCMKQPHLIISLLIPGPSSPGEKIDIFLQPLIDELIDLWINGIPIYDAHTNSNFCMRAALMWTINDFPAYGMLSGWNTQSKFACPSCGFQTCSEWLYHGGKYCYMGHRRFLRNDHPYRKNKRSFDGTEEWGSKPLVPNGSTIVGQWDGDIIIKNCKGDVVSPQEGLRKKSIFFTLPYWEFNLIRHNLDVMHIEKNVFDNIMNTVLNVKDKTKDNLKARRDLERMGIRKDLHPTQLPNGKVELRSARFAMSKVEKERVLGVLKNVKVPDGYSSNVSRCVKLKKNNIAGLKSHDCHVLMQDLFPVAIRGSLEDKVCQVIIDLCYYFREICGKVLKISRLEELEEQIGETLSTMEMIFPPSFFTISVHLVTHLAREARLGGPVHYRWMYPIERFLLTLKSYVRNRAYPEGSIAEGYLADESITFCSRYFEGVETRFNRSTRNSDDVEVAPPQDAPLRIVQGRAVGQEEDIIIDEKTLAQAHRCILYNCDSILPFIEEHKSIVRGQYHKRKRRRSSSDVEIEKIHHEKFPDWFRSQVARLSEIKSTRITNHVRWLAQGPNNVAKRFKGYMIRGIRFQTKEVEEIRKTQNSGIVVMTKTSCLEDDLPYYGVLNDIIELNYYDRFKVVLFKGNWVDVERGKGIKHDKFGYTLVNLSKLVHTGVHVNDEPFVLASQVQQVFYVQDPLQRDWQVVVKSKPRDTYDMGDELEFEFSNEYQNHLSTIREEEEEQEEVCWVRTDIENDIVEDDSRIPATHDE